MYCTLPNVSEAAKIHEILPASVSLCMGVMSSTNVALEPRHSCFSLASLLVLNHDVAQLGPCSHYSTDSSYSLITMGLVFTSQSFHIHLIWCPV